MIPGTSVEIAKLPSRGKIRFAIFDFDGTLSFLRDGWQDHMVPMMVEVLQACPQTEGRDEIEKLVVHFVDHLTGKQTIYQMIRLAEEVARRGGTPREPLEYKYEYNRRLGKSLEGRLEDLRSGKALPDAHLVKGSREFLEELVRRGIVCYLASGTDIEFVREESKLLDVDKYFGDRIHGALPNYKDFSKEKVIRKILSDFQLSGPELLIVGDGYVEIQNGRDVDAVTLGVHTVERNHYHMNTDKRDRLLRAGAHLLAPDLSDGALLLDYLRVGVGG